MSDVYERLRGWESYANGGAHPGVPAVRNGEAADEIAALKAENERLRKREAHLFEMVKRCERDVQRALRDAKAEGGDYHVCGGFQACEAIQQRAAGLGEPEEVEQ
jgi:basic membrane lipoprotein Med (substrate-binding protein (PBP1-ABC) superfamily)